MKPGIYCNGEHGVTPEHKLLLPFTRFLAGPAVSKRIPKPPKCKAR